MSSATLPALPPDVLRCVARAALAAEGGNALTRARLSFVCRTWRDSLEGAGNAAHLRH